MATVTLPYHTRADFHASAVEPGGVHDASGVPVVAAGRVS